MGLLSLDWIPNNTIYIHRGNNSTMYFICKFRTNNTGLKHSYASPEQTKQDRYQETLEAAGDKVQRIKKGNKSGEPVEYGIWMPTPQLTQQAESIGRSPMSLKCFHLVLLL